MSSSAVNKTPRQGASSSPRNAQQQRGLLIIGAVVAVAIIAVVAIIALGGAGSADIDYSTLPMSRASDGAFVLGDENAPITLIEFADFRCPHCQAYHPTMTQFIQDFVVTGKAKFEYRMVTYTGGSLSRYASQILECAYEQNPAAFWEGHDLMYVYATTGRFNMDIGRLLATDLNLNLSELLSCSSSADQYAIDETLAQNVNISGTPAILVRYADSAPQFITFGGTTYSQGGTSLSVISSVVNAANQQ